MEVPKMKFISYVKVSLAVALPIALAGCGGGGGGSGTPVIPVAVTANSPVLTNYSTTVFANFSGTSVADGTAVNFAIAAFKSFPSNGGGSAELTAETRVTSGLGGKQRASVRVKSNIHSDVTVAVTSGNYAGNKTIQFIPQPDKAVVHVALDRNVSNLAALSVIVKNDLGSVFTVPTAPTVAPFKSYTSIARDNSFITNAGQDVFAWLLLKLGVNAVATKPLLDITFTRDPIATVSGIPVFAVEADLVNPQRLSFNNYTSSNVTPPSGVSAENLLAVRDYLLTVDYYLGNVLLATK